MGSDFSAAPTPEQEAENAASFEEASAACPEGMHTCATLAEDGRPIYFHAPIGATTDQMRELAFRHRNGRDMSEYEKTVLAEAERERNFA